MSRNVFLLFSSLAWIVSRLLLLQGITVPYGTTHTRVVRYEFLAPSFERCNRVFVVHPRQSESQLRENRNLSNPHSPNKAFQTSTYTTTSPQQQRKRRHGIDSGIGIGKQWAVGVSDSEPVTPAALNCHATKETDTSKQQANNKRNTEGWKHEHR